MPVNAAYLNLMSGYAGLCLRWTRLVLGAPPLAPTAYAAWLSSTTKHRGDRNPPYGVPVFWSAGRTGRYAGAGHVAVSLGGGWVKSTSWPSGSSIGVTGITNIERAWGRTYLGWTETLNGRRIYWPPEPAPTPALTAIPDRDTREPIVTIVHVAAENNWYRVGELTVELLTDMKQVRAAEKIWGAAIDVTPDIIQEEVRRTIAARNSLRIGLGV